MTQDELKHSSYKENILPVAVRSLYLSNIRSKKITKQQLGFI